MIPTNPLDANTVALIGIPVVALTQLAKWQGLPDRWGPVAVILFSVLGVGLWVASQPAGFARTDLFNYFVAIMTVATAAAGVFGFTRAGAAAVTATREPPAGAAQHVTSKP